jgi:hypothetical protein
MDMERAMKLLRVFKQKMDADREQRKADIKAMHQKMDAMQEEMRVGHEEMMAKLDAHHERMVACLGKTEATDLKANPEEVKPETVHREVPKEEAAVKYSGALKKRHRHRHLAAGRRVSRREGPGEIGRRRQKDDPPYMSGTGQGTCRQEESD